MEGFENIPPDSYNFNIPVTFKLMKGTDANETAKRECTLVEITISSN